MGCHIVNLKYSALRKKTETEIMKIAEELKEKVFAKESDFFDKLTNEWRGINANYLDSQGQNDYERAFLNILTEEIYKKLPSYKVIPFVKLNAIEEFSPEERAETTLGRHLEDIRGAICWSGWSDQKCRSKKCFDGEYPSGTEVDGLIIRDKAFCLLEYENLRSGICDNFMKIYRLQRLLNRPFESLFVTKVTTTRQEEGTTTFESFNKYIDRIKPMLNKLLEDWNVLEIVNLSGSERKKRFHWRP